MGKRTKEKIAEDMAEWYSRLEKPNKEAMMSQLRLADLIFQRDSVSSSEGDKNYMEICRSLIILTYKFEQLENGVLMGVARAVDICYDNGYVDAQETLDVIRDYVMESPTEELISDINSLIRGIRSGIGI